jgi:ADP-ribosylglycohydrolase
MHTELNTGIQRDIEESIIGCIVGTALGDAVGLPCEGLSRLRQRELFPHLDGTHFLLGRGMVSDDTLLPRNVLFLVVVMTHGFRRLLPPY